MPLEKNSLSTACLFHWLTMKAEKFKHGQFLEAPQEQLKRFVQVYNDNNLSGSEK